MPAPRTNTGLPERNRIVGADWSGLSVTRRSLFHPPLFHQLARSILPNPTPIPPPERKDDPHNPADITALVPDFQELVDKAKVIKDASENCLSIKTADHEKRGRVEVAKLVCQVSQFYALTSSNCLFFVRFGTDQTNSNLHIPQSLKQYFRSSTFTFTFLSHLLIPKPL